MNDQPLGFHVQHATGSYTRVDQMKMKTRRGPRRPRSAVAPTARTALSNGEMPDENVYGQTHT